MTTFTTEFATAYQSECFPPDLTNEIRKGRACLKRVAVYGASTDLALAAYLVWSKLGQFMHDGYDYEAEDFLVVGEVSDMVTDHDAELLAEIDPAVRNRVGSPAGGMSPEVTAVHDLLLEVSYALARSWAEQEVGA
jgi:hypothetical protein